MKTLPIYAVIDCSGSMNINQAIEYTNQTIEKSLHTLQALEKTLSTATHPLKLKLNIVRVSTQAHWHLQAVALEEIQWQPLKAEGYTALGQGLHMVLEDINKSLNTLTPIVYVVSDGLPTDYEHYRNIAPQLRQKATCMAFTLGQEIESHVLDMLTKQVFSVDKPSQLPHTIMRFISREIEREREYLINRERELKKIEREDIIQANQSPPPLQSKNKLQANIASSKSPDLATKLEETHPLWLVSKTESSKSPDLATELEDLKQFFESGQGIKYKDYQILRVSMTNNETYIKGGIAQFENVQSQNTFFVVSLKSSAYAFTNNKRSYNAEQLHQRGLDAWFKIENQLEKGHSYYPQVLTPAEVKKTGSKWELVKKGLCHMVSKETPS